MSDLEKNPGTTVAALRRQLAQMEGRPGVPPSTGSRVLPVPAPIAELLPRRGLVAGTVAEVSGASTAAVALLAQVSAAGGTAALVGLPQLNLAVAAELGADLDRVAVVPEPGVDALEVAAVLLDGIDLVLVAADRVTPSRARVLTGRARRQSSTLLAVGAPGCWPGAAVRIEAQVAGYRHAPGAVEIAPHNGYGRIGGLRLDVTVSGTGISPRSVRCELAAQGLGETGLAGSGRLRLVAAAQTPQAQTRPRLAVAN